MKSSIIYKGYIIDVDETRDDYRYVIKLGENIIAESASGFPFPSDAEMQAKLYINRLTLNKDGWRAL